MSLLYERNDLYKKCIETNTPFSYTDGVEVLIAALAANNVPGFGGGSGGGGAGLTNVQLRASPLPLAAPRALVVDTASSGLKTANFSITNAAFVDFEVLTGTITVNGVAYTPSTISGQTFNIANSVLPELEFDFSPSSSGVFQVMRYA